jgi:hypothetical protein
MPYRTALPLKMQSHSARPVRGNHGERHLLLHASLTTRPRDGAVTIAQAAHLLTGYGGTGRM